MKVKYETNYAGYFTVLRGLFLLLQNKTLTLTQLGAYVFFVSQVDFDRRHKNYRAIIRDDEELAKQSGNNKSTIYRKRKELIKKGLLIEEDGVTKVANYYVFELEWSRELAKLPSSLLQTFFAKREEEIAEEPFIIEKMQRKQPQNRTQSSNLSSKGDVGFSDGDIDYITESLEDNGE